jgi:transketolase
MRVWRPCDAVETAAAWRDAIECRDGPTSLVLTRQGLPHQLRSGDQVEAIGSGGYVLRDGDGEPDLILIATGSEVPLAVSAAEELTSEGITVRVVSMPCTEVFDDQADDYREAVLPAGVTKRIAIEAGVTDGWWRYVGPSGRVIGMHSFGQSAPAGELFRHYGFSHENVMRIAREVLAQD